MLSTSLFTRISFNTFAASIMGLNFFVSQIGSLKHLKKKPDASEPITKLFG